MRDKWEYPCLHRGTMFHAYPWQCLTLLQRSIDILCREGFMNPAGHTCYEGSFMMEISHTDGCYRS